MNNLKNGLNRYIDNNENDEDGMLKKISKKIASLQNKDATSDEVEINPTATVHGSKVSTAVGTKASVKSMRLDNNLIEAVQLYVNYQRLFGKDLKANENQVFALAIKQFVEQPEVAKKINKMKNFYEE